jgi:hypothetical protein
VSNRTSKVFKGTVTSFLQYGIFIILQVILTPLILEIAMQEKFGLRYEISEANTSVDATGSKPYYYSLNTRAADFGYEPALTSLAGIAQEAEEMLKHGWQCKL